MNHKFLAAAFIPLFALTFHASAVMAHGFEQGQDWHGDDRGHGNHGDHGWHDDGHHDHDDRWHGDDHGRHLGWDRHYRRGERLPERYRGPEFYVSDYARYHLYAPPAGYRWIRGDNGEFVLVAMTTGLIVQELLGH